MLGQIRGLDFPNTVKCPAGFVYISCWYQGLINIGWFSTYFSLLYNTLIKKINQEPLVAFCRNYGKRKLETPGLFSHFDFEGMFTAPNIVPS